jgi:phospholipid-binding lipoprotein MlaA
MNSLLRRCTALSLLLMLQACATVSQPNPHDPFESFNRSVSGFNDTVDDVVLKPAATVYKGVTPSWFRTGVRNFFNNIQDVWSAVNNGLQGRGAEMGDSIGRVMTNTTIGVLGLFDVATELNIERHTADFGLTLGRWGVRPGPYVVLPLLGPYTLREVGALPVDWSGDLVYQLGDQQTVAEMTVLKLVDYRASLLGASEVLDGAALDKYAFTRDAYLQRQRNKEYDGNPPEEEEQVDKPLPQPKAPD